MVDYQLILLTKEYSCQREGNVSSLLCRIHAWPRCMGYKYNKGGDSFESLFLYIIKIGGMQGEVCNMHPYYTSAHYVTINAYLFYIMSATLMSAEYPNIE